jgi:phosphoribosylaminoimidazole (AIR) synthetase
MGVGLVLVSAPKDSAGLMKALAKVGEKPSLIGKVVRGGAGEVRVLES